MMFDPNKRWFDSFALAISAVFSHTAFILAFAALTHFGGHLIFGEKVDHFLMDNLKLVGSGALICIGSYLIICSRKAQTHCCTSKSHGHKHSRSTKIPFLLGISIGLYPCPTLIATFLASINTGQLQLGIIGISLFALGSFISILSSGVILKWLGSNFADKYSSKLSQFNWKLLQGAVVFAVGIITLFGHKH